MAKNTNWDDAPDDEINESLYERIVGLGEFFPSFVNSAVSNSISATKVIAKNAFYYGSNGIWILATTFVIMVLPFAVQKELHELEKSEQQARQAMLLGPQKKAIQK
uniref:Mitochondrial import receptor subunit TOM22 homolog n=1 Tax=Parastrongyloides trichosuri TaxID=131310 RepID=A0A0N4ZR74_PARTI